MTTDYRQFIASKRKTASAVGFSVESVDLNSNLWDWQSLIVQWCLRLGRAAVFADCGLGKTLIQLAWAEQVTRHTDKPVLILCPLAVGWQTKREAERFGIRCPVRIVAAMTDIAADSGICICNYEKLHLFDCSVFGGVVLDESSVLKNYTGKTKQALISEFRNTRFKLACTATPAPNDMLELGNHAEFLGIMPSNEMIARWFINDSMKCGKYRLKAHGEQDYWKWVSSWAVCISKPCDLGEQFQDNRYTLPELKIVKTFLESESIPKGYLINPGKTVSATNVHEEKRASLIQRCREVVQLVKTESRKPWVVWCGTDYEANEILRQLGVRGDGKDDLGGVVEVRGSHSVETKEDRLNSFSRGLSRVIITKPEIGGFGLNWQHCDQMTWFASFSYEQFYQSVRRMLRFGQQAKAVTVHVIASENEESVVQAIAAKEQQHLEMKSGMSERMKAFTQESVLGGDGDSRNLKRYVPKTVANTPEWLQTH